ncbi:hypothetical protein PPTG_21642 [Phytophthora nicotianae INRA-310]|uniref:Uncharacterized protein n=1 Tax=Phytophthora nicotianae (strain INRA-310) TaxID=761204 RepID=W2QW44_PHYN3|nr:hypothetical protein PPTG_21642 [Phytophthora nicotianae INRA-310]ETN17333.1 hypothetical protein PPTG_21642 [Phytophthora nicotianae INRA-310]
MDNPRNMYMVMYSTGIRSVLVLLWGTGLNQNCSYNAKPQRHGKARLLLSQLVDLNKCLPAHWPAPSRANRFKFTVTFFLGLFNHKLQFNWHVLCEWHPGWPRLQGEVVSRAEV